ncbi:MAG: ATP-binding protein [Proteobacteria bacterium]|nr:ATP-binding protein [Pseudomonadota bacterium]
MINQTVRLYGAMAQERGVTLTMSVDKEFPGLLVDAEVLEGILGNLVSNAIKFTPSGGCVAVEARVTEKDGAAILVVTDSGVGMAPETIKNILHGLPVSPGVGLHGDVGSGFGLGLVMKRLAKLGIHLAFRNNAGEGTSVIITFPGPLTQKST